MFKPGELVRHKNKPEWGVGRVTGETGEGKVLVKFTGRAGDVLLTPSGAEQFLVPDTGAAWAPPSRAASAAPAPIRRTPCVHCAQDLREVVTSTNGEWRSCPECSTKHGRQHVLLPLRDFDALPASSVVPPAASADAASANDEAPPAPVAEAEPADPRANWCRYCRAGQRSSGFRVCKDANREKPTPQHATR